MSRTVAGLFAGIGGVELGLEQRGWSTTLFCELDAGAQAVLGDRFPDVDVVADVRSLPDLPSVDLVTAGFPCQDLSQAGQTRGIGGAQSSLVNEVLRLVSPSSSSSWSSSSPDWLLLENVPFMLRLQRGRGMRYVTSALGELGFRWAYRVVDARAFGLPQRRQRVVLLASRTEDPRSVLFSGSCDEPSFGDPDAVACGFYWTEGTRGLGWAVDAVPTLKGGSGLGIPSPPAIRMPSGTIVTPGITDAERLQGFAPDWTKAALTVPGVRPGHRWKLVGNAVSTRMSAWVADRLDAPVPFSGPSTPLSPGSPWPVAAWGEGSSAYSVGVSSWPVRASYEHLATFVTDPTPLSAKATAGFLRRARASSLRFVDGFLDDVAAHLAAMAAVRNRDESHPRSAR